MALFWGQAIFFQIPNKNAMNIFVQNKQTKTLNLLNCFL